MFRSKCISFNKNKMHAWHKCKQRLSTKRQLCVNTTKRQDIKNHMLLNNLISQDNKLLHTQIRANR